jgi:hypothetical protein
MNDTLIYGLGSLAIGLIGLLIRYSFKSKCSDVSILWGCLAIHRNIEEEIKEQQLEAQTPSRDMSLRNLASV